MAKIKGWYYDRQLDSPLTSATLHANMWWDNDKKEFKNWNQIMGENGFGNNGNRCDQDLYETINGAVKGACGYGLDPICTSILGEDFNVAISNTWSEFGGDPIGEAWNNLRGPLAGTSRAMIENMDTLIANNKKARESGQELGTWAQWTSKAVDWIGDKVAWVRNKTDFDIVSFLNKALVTNGTRFTYYGGTGINFGNLGMKFTVFPQWKNNEFLEVPAQVEKLYPYFIGQLEKFKDATGVDSNTMPGDIANKVFMFQDPPGGYLADMNSIDKIQRGTLKLKIGSFYEISNLVCSDVMLNFSKNMVKNPKTQMISPLFCDVNITLRPSTKYSDQVLRKFVGGSNSARNAIKNIITENLTNEQTKLRSSIEANNYMIDQD